MKQVNLGTPRGKHMIWPFAKLSRKPAARECNGHPLTWLSNRGGTTLEYYYRPSAVQIQFAEEVFAGAKFAGIEIAGVVVWVKPDSRTVCAHLVFPDGSYRQAEAPFEVAFGSWDKGRYHFQCTLLGIQPVQSSNVEDNSTRDRDPA